jgi:hypothetical protein
VTAVNISILSVLYITHLLQITKIRMFLYARIYWLAEFWDVSCLQLNYSSYNFAGVKKSTSPTPRASNFHIWASWNNQLYARWASEKKYWILTNLSIFGYLLIFIQIPPSVSTIILSTPAKLYDDINTYSCMKVLGLKTKQVIDKNV